MNFISTPPPTPPHTTPLNSAPPTPSAASTSFRLPAQPTILLKSPSDETIARLRQLAPYYWSHPQTTNCAIHFPIDPKQQARIQAYQARQRQASIAAQSRSRQGSVVNSENHPLSSHQRRPSITPPSPTPTHSLSRPSSTHRLRAVHSGSGLTTISARHAILGTSSAGSTPEPEPLSKRRGSITPGYDPFSKAGTSLVSQPSSPTPSGRRESTPVSPLQPINGSTLSVPSTPDILRRGSAPVSGGGKTLTPMRTVRLHVEYLTAHSALIRQVLAEAAGYIPPVLPSNSTTTPPNTTPASPTSLATPPPDSPQSPTTNPFPHSFFRFSPHRYPRVIHPKTSTPGAPSSSSAGGPTIILPVPDPTSFPLLIHYIYHGKMDAIERTLREGSVTWEGLVRNVEYLGLREDVKRYLGRWWRNWRDAEGRRVRGEGKEQDDEEEEEEGKSGYPYSGVDLKMDVEDGEEWASASASVSAGMTGAGAGAGELVDEMAGLLDRF